MTARACDSHPGCRKGSAGFAFSVQLLGRRLRVEIGPDKATYTLLSGSP